MNILEKAERVAELRKKLADTDYKALKYAEGELSATEYAPVLEARREWRAEINAIQTEVRLAQSK